ncbi:hypothetical protein [Roseateles asaccharophilus]|uniref:Uncharacterized protein n=1 Tax=Roseateles asaccharophilus TaxID=582607 RepID=A0ABU2A3T2_9BURK|nr:hypothetical protein [Roseateles asaccharophilus]MDR7331849.1 hypothetical protein [Roseateles asaccharophilus]
MRRWFLALMALLVAAQMSWAGAQLCCVDELAEQASTMQANEAARADKAGEPHAVCETGHCHCHHAGCATPIDQADGLPLTQAAPPEPGVAARPKSHIPAGLERPNWQRA